MSSAVGSNNKPAPSVAQSVAGVDNTGVLRQLSVDSSGNLNVNATAPVGGATAANQVLEIAELQDINTNTAGLLTDTQLRASPIPVSAASLPLPSGAATEATLAAFSDKTASAAVVEAYDYQSISYVGITTDIDTVVFKSGGAGGTTVATLTMGYDGSNRLTSITKT